MSTDGFYRVDDDGVFHRARWVRAPDYSLDWEHKDTYTYPTQGGWYWFDNKEQALAHFNLPEDTLYLGETPQDA